MIEEFRCGCRLTTDEREDGDYNLWFYPCRKACPTLLTFAAKLRKLGVPLARVVR